MASATKEERHGEIWSSRVQKELLALTTDGAGDGTDEVRQMLPSFVSVKEHKLDIGRGSCIVSFAVEVSRKSDISEAKDIVVTLDASMARNADGTLDSLAPAYPFVPPVPILTSGHACFPEGSTIKDGDRISMDLDWTPSLHLTDAVMNLGLKIKESILQGEPFYPEPAPTPVDEMKMAMFAANFTKKASKSISSAFAQQPRKTKPSKKKKAAAPSEIKIGDEIDMLEEPWVGARGVYSCKAIRRPKFVSESIEVAHQNLEQKAFETPRSMFRSFTQSARSVLEETFLMVTETHIIELKSSRLNPSLGTVVFAISIDLMAKLKFRRQESLSLFFKPAPTEALIYMCPDSGDAVHQIQSVLKQHGVRGKHTNAAAYRAINEAMQLVQEIQTKELALKHDPTVERVNEIMDLYRQAAERFEVAGDIRHEEVVTHMRKFLALPLTCSILDGSYKKPAPPTPSPTNKDGKPVGEVLERAAALLEDDELDGPGSKEKEKASDKAFEENMDNLLKEAKEDFQKFNIDGDGTVDTATSSVGSEDAGLAEVAADLDAMMREADKELAELMKS